MIVVAIIGLLAAVAIPNMMKAMKTSKKTACINQLKAIEGAKITWAFESKKGEQDVPTDADLFGTDKGIKRKPECPSNGTYTLNAVGENPTCSIPEHVLP